MRAPGPAAAPAVNIGGEAAFELPAVMQGEAADARPSMLFIGDSGTGKTFSLGRIMRKRKTLLLAVEMKAQNVLKYRPKIQHVGTPVKLANGTWRPVSMEEKYERLMRFSDAVAAGKFREVDGEKIELIAVDGLMEMGEVFKRHWLSDKKVPRDRDGAKNTYAAYDIIGAKMMDYCKTLRDAASEAARLYDQEPVGILATVGEVFETDKFGNNGKYVPILPGNVAPRNLPYIFEAIFRLEVSRNDPESGGDGNPKFLVHTVKGENFFAKSPDAGLEAVLENPDMGDVYDKLVEHYKLNVEAITASQEVSA